MNMTRYELCGVIYGTLRDFQRGDRKVSNAVADAILKKEGTAFNWKGVCIVLGISFVILTFVCTTVASAKETITGPVSATVVRVIDGDTIIVRAHLWLGLKMLVKVRLAGIDTPELRGKCVDEREKAILARQALSMLIGKDRKVLLSSIQRGKYAGRVIATVRVSDALQTLSDALISGNHARVYFGKKRKGWCK